MTRLLEIILGLDKGFLSREGDFSLQFNPHWPGQDAVGAVTWNVVLALLCAGLVWYVYRPAGGDGRRAAGVPAGPADPAGADAGAEPDRAVGRGRHGGRQREHARPRR